MSVPGVPPRAIFGSFARTSRSRRYAALECAVSERPDDDPVGESLKRLNRLRHESEQLRARIERLRNHKPEALDRGGDSRFAGDVQFPFGEAPRGDDSGVY